MEVHHHPDIHHKPKKWKEYFIEFLMIFLAVTMGFFAEGFREHINDRAKEKEYMQSLLEDLKYDTLKYQEAINKMEILKPALDSSYLNVKEANRFNYVLQGKWQYIINEISTEYRPSLPTIQQMKSSGNLRLVENKEVGNKIMKYDAFVKSNVERLNDNIHVASGKVYAMEDIFCDYINFRKINISGELDFNDTSKYADFDMPFVEKDLTKLNEFANSFINYKTVGLSYIKTVIKGKAYATDLIKYINEEYHYD